MPEAESAEIVKAEQRLIKKVGEDIERRHYNTAISAIMKFVNEVSRVGKWANEQRGFGDTFGISGPLLAEELWFKLGHKESVHIQPWPSFDPELAADEKKLVVVQVNGKVRIGSKTDRMFSRGGE